MDKARIEALAALLDKATPGSWSQDTGGDVTRNDGSTLFTRVDECVGLDESFANAALVEAMHNALPELLRIARAVAVAPRVPVTDAEVIALAGGRHWFSKIFLLGSIAKELGGQKVLLLRADAVAGEGETP